MTVPLFLSEEDVHIVPAEGLAVFGGQEGVRSEHLLKSALSMPEQSFGGEFLHVYPFGMAAVAYHIAENQPFVDGNKRTALGCTLLFLLRVGYEIKDPENKLYSAMIDIGNRRLTKERLAAILAEMARPVAEGND